MQKQVDVLIIGAGTAGLAAVKEVEQYTQNYLLVDHGPLGTTCALNGCMPSKALIQIAQDFYRHRHLQKTELLVGNNHIQLPAVFAQVRKLRDAFVSGNINDIKSLGEHFIQGHARFTGMNTLLIDDKLQVQAKRIIVATGTKPIIPEEWPKLHPSIVTSDNFFDLEHIPQQWAIIGMGPSGLELGQALAYLGLDVCGFDQNDSIGGLSDPHLNDLACKVMGNDLQLNLGQAVEVREHQGQLQVGHGAKFQTVDAILSSIGRKPNLKSLELDKAGCVFDKDGFPLFDSQTQSLQGTSIFFAGDVDKVLPILHEAADDGRIAGYNATHEAQFKFKRRTHMAITFTSPGIATVGAQGKNVKDAIVGVVSYEDQGRAKIMGENRGALQIYVDRTTTRLLGAEMFSPAAEHLAHLLAWSIQSELNLHDMLRLPFYHPTLEEGLRTALLHAAKQLPEPIRGIPMQGLSANQSHFR